MNFYEIKSLKTGKIYNEQKNYTLDPNGGVLDVVYDYTYIKAKLNLYDLKHTPISHLKYLDFFPIKDRSKVVTKGEGNTPLYHLLSLGKKLHLNNLFLKNEGMNPTGVFKDRGTMVEITKAKEMGARAICVASTGNMAASVSAYAALAGLPCYVLVPEGTPVGKLAQTLSYGARVLQIRGTYDNCVRLARGMSEKYGYFLCGDYPFRREGQKSASYEIVEQLSWKAPDWLIVPIGFGTNLSALFKGFYEFKKMGFIDKLPRIIGVQAAGCSPIADAWAAQKRTYKPVEKPNTVAQAVAVGDPQDAPFVFNALKQTKGRAVKIKDEAALDAQHELGKYESIFVEPSGALPYAALQECVMQKRIQKDDTVVLIGTGNGLKDPRAVLKKVATPPTVDPEMKEVDRFLKFKLYKLTANARKGEDQRIVMKREMPNARKLQAMVKSEFDLQLPKKYTSLVLKELEIFVKKRKDVSRMDLKRIVEDTLKEQAKKRTLTIVDFEVQTWRNKPARASILVQYQNKEYTSCGEGVGPFDAIIQSLCQALPKDALWFELVDYFVEIDSARSDATVKVAMTMQDAKGSKVIATATSPDVITASVLAYEEGYNLLA